MIGAVTKLYDIDRIEIPKELLDLRVAENEIEEKVQMLSLRYAKEYETEVAALGDTVFCKADDISYPDGRTILLYTGTRIPGGSDAVEKALGKRVNDCFSAALMEKTVTLTVRKILRRTPVEVNDALISRIGIEGVTTLAEYRAHVKEQMLADMRMERHKAIFAFFLGELEKKSEYAYDQQELDAYIQSLIAQYPPDAGIEMSQEELRERVFSQIKESWIAEAFCKSRGIEIDMKEVEDAADQMLQMQELMGEEVPAKEEMMEMYLQNVRFGAMYEYVDKIATGKLGG